MKTFLGIVGTIVALPLAIIVVGLIIVTLLGGYICWMLSIIGDVLLLLLTAIIIHKGIKYFIKKRG